MAAPSTTLVKAWCRITSTEFDAVLPTMIAAATAIASHEVGVDYTTTTMPDAVQQWVAATVCYWVDHPEAATERAMNPSPFLVGLLDPYRAYSWSDPT